MQVGGAAGVDVFHSLFLPEEPPGCDVVFASHGRVRVGEVTHPVVVDCGGIRHRQSSIVNPEVIDLARKGCVAIHLRPDRKSGRAGERIAGAEELLFAEIAQSNVSPIDIGSHRASLPPKRQVVPVSVAEERAGVNFGIVAIDSHVPNDRAGIVDLGLRKARGGSVLEHLQPLTAAGLARPERIGEVAAQIQGSLRADQKVASVGVVVGEIILERIRVEGIAGLLIESSLDQQIGSVTVVGQDTHDIASGIAAGGAGLLAHEPPVQEVVLERDGVKG